MKRRSIVLLTLAILLILGVLCGFLLRTPPAAPLVTEPVAQAIEADTLADGYLLTIDGHGVSEDEFRFFLRQAKSQTTYDYYRQYGAEMTADYWHTAHDGKTPLEYAKELALAALTRAKIQLILADERDILPYQSFTTLTENMAAENEERAQKTEDGEVFYGLTGYDILSYHSYTQANIAAELEYSQRDLSKPTTAQLQDVYDRHQNSFYQGTIYEYEIQYPNGTTEVQTQSDMEIGKEDDLMDYIVGSFSEMSPKELLRDVPWDGETVNLLLLSTESLGNAEIDAARPGLLDLFAQEELARIIAARSAQAEIQIDQVSYDAIEME